MVQIILKQSDFVNNKFTFPYSNREALFTIIDEEFAGHNQLGRINRITILVRKKDENAARFCTTVIGLGDGTVGIKSDDVDLHGKLLNKDTMERCTIVLYEDGDA